MPETLLRDEMDLNWSSIKQHNMILLFLVTILNSRAGMRPRYRDLVNYNLIHGTLCIYCSFVSLASKTTRLSEELLQEGSGPAVVKVPAFGRVADVGRVQQQGQGFGFVDSAEDSVGEN